MSLIEVREMSKSYETGGGRFDALKNISLDIQSREFVSIMGPSGSGKSTLLYVLGGLEKPTQGKALIDGQELHKLPDSDLSRFRRREMGFIFQFYNLVQNLTVEDNIVLPAILDGKTRREAMMPLDILLRAVGLLEKRQSLPSQLSGGQQQRVAIARALINRPKIIFADEPTGNLDSQSGWEIMRLLRRVHDELGTTIVQVTHNQELSGFGNRMISVRDGRIVNDEWLSVAI